MPSKPWRTEAVILFIAAQFFCFFAGMIAVSFLHRFHVHGFLKEDDFGNIIIATLCFQGATCLLIPLFLRLHEVSWREAFGLDARPIRSVLLAIVTLMIVLPVALWLQQCSFLLMHRFGWEPAEEEAVTLIAGANTLPMKIYLGFFAVVMAPIAEEFFFRGLLYPFIKQLGFPKTALFGSAFLFAAIHANAAVFVSLFILALAFTWLYERTGNLLAPVFAHSLFNGVNLVMLVFQEQIQNWLQKLAHT